MFHLVGNISRGIHFSNLTIIMFILECMQTMYWYCLTSNMQFVSIGITSKTRFSTFSVTTVYIFHSENETTSIHKVQRIITYIFTSNNNVN